MVIVGNLKSLGGWIKLICRNAYLTKIIIEEHAVYRHF